MWPRLFYVYISQVMYVSQGFPPKPCMHLPSLHTFHMPSQSHSFQFITRIIFIEEHRSLSSSLWYLLHYPVTSSSLGPKIFLSALYSNIIGLRSSLSVDQLSHPHKTTGKIIVLCTVILILFDTKREHKKSDIYFFYKCDFNLLGRSQIPEL